MLRRHRHARPRLHPPHEPAGAANVDRRWYVSGTGPHTFRGFTGSSWIVDSRDGDIRVAILGIQESTGTIARSIVAGDDLDLTPAQARQLARCLVAVADETDCMNEE